MALHRTRLINACDWACAASIKMHFDLVAFLLRCPGLAFGPGLWHEQGGRAQVPAGGVGGRVCPREGRRAGGQLRRAWLPEVVGC